MKMKKRLLSILLILVLMLGLMPGMNLTAYAIEGTAWNSTNSLPVNGGVFYLEDDVTVTTVQRAGTSGDYTWYIENDTTIDLNGHSITLQRNNLWNYINIKSNKTFTIKDSVGNGVIRQDRPNNGDSKVIVVNGVLNLEGGTITGGKFSDNGDYGTGAGVVVQGGGTFNMSGGVITGNTLTYTGSNSSYRGAAGVYCAGTTGDATFNMTGGIIKGNTVSGSPAYEAIGHNYSIKGTISGGYIQGTCVNIFSITGGFFTVNPSSEGFCKTGAIPSTHMVKEINETIGGVNYKYQVVPVPTHTHDFTYYANGATITATCSGDDCDLTNRQATLTIAAAGGTYDGTTAFSATVTNNIPAVEGDTVGSIEYYKGNTADATTGGTMQTSAPVNAGYYYANVTLTSGSNSYTAVKAFTIAKGTAEALNVDTARTNSGINYQTEQATPLSGYQISTDNANPVASTPVILTDILDGNTPTIYVRRAENDNQNAGEWVSVTLTARPSKPTAPATENATNDSTADGKIKSALATWEYKNKDTDKEPTNWTAMTAGDMLVKSGTYQIRVKATDSAPHGKVTEVTVGSNYVALTEANKPTIAVSGSHNPPVVGDTLTASTTATDIVYEWYRDGEKIPSATASTYTLTADDVGKAITVKVTQTKQADGTLYADGSEPTQTSDATAAVVKKSSPDAPANAAAADFVINYIKETFTVGNDYEVSTTQSDTGLISDGSLTSAIDSTDHKVYIRAKETSDTQAGAWLTVTLLERPPIPATLTTTNATNGSTADGKINGTDNYMEYKNKAENGEPADWTTATQSATLVKPGTYFVRIAASVSSFHGAEKEVTVGSKEIVLSDGQKPTAKTGLTYNGTEQALINAPTAVLPEGATEIRYALGTDATTAPTDGWSTSIPTGTDAKTYYVWYKVIADAKHNDSDPVCIKVVIQPAAYAVLKMENTEYTIGSGKKAVITVTRSVEDNRTFSLYTGSSMDGKPIASGNCDTAPGSLVLTLKAYYLDSLSVGDHKLTISFKDGSVDTTVKILPVPPTSTAAPTATPKPVPKTGDTTNPALWLGLILLGLIGAAGTVLVSVRKK